MPLRQVPFVRAGDAGKHGNDFLLMADAEPAPAPAPSSDGRMVASLDTDHKSVRSRHIGYTIPDSGMLFANDHDVGRTFMLDVRDQLRPSLVSSFNNMASFAHPHFRLRLPNGNMLATFQHGQATLHSGAMGKSGGLVTIDDRGKMVRSASTADPDYVKALLVPYSLAVLTEIDRIVSTKPPMHDDDLLSGITCQVWRLCELELISSAYFHPGVHVHAHLAPEKASVALDGSVLLPSRDCGVARISGIDFDAPVARLAHTFPGNWCGVPVIVGRYWVQSARVNHDFIVLDLADTAHPVEVSRLRISDNYAPHRTAWDTETQRILIKPAPQGSSTRDRTYLLTIDPDSGALSVDQNFRDAYGPVGFSFGERTRPHGCSGAALPHGAVFSRSGPVVAP